MHFKTDINLFTQHPLTFVSPYTESGILADFSSLSPEECLENPHWPHSTSSSASHNGVSLKKSNSILTNSSGTSVSTTSSSSSSSRSTANKSTVYGCKSKTKTLPAPIIASTAASSNNKVHSANSNTAKEESFEQSQKSNSNSSISDVYLNENHVTVHL